jgi:hypothetical protein
VSGRRSLALGAGRWVGEQFLFRVVPAAVGVIGATVWEAEFPIVGRVAIGALLGEAAGLMMQAAIDFRTRDLGERAMLEVADAAIALRESELFTASLPGDSFDYSRGPRAALAVVLAAIRGPGLRFHFAQAERRWSGAWQDLDDARQRFTSAVGPYTPLLDGRDRRAVQLVVKDVDAAIGAAAGLTATWDELSTYLQFGETEDQRYSELEAERRIREGEFADALETLIQHCDGCERKALPHRIVTTPGQREEERASLHRRALAIVRRRAQGLLRDGVPEPACSESSTLAGTKDIDLRLIAATPTFDFIGERPLEGWSNFSAALSQAGTRFEHLTHHQEDRLHDRVRDLVEEMPRLTQRAGNAAADIFNDYQTMEFAQRANPVDDTAVADRRGALIDHRTSFFSRLDELLGAIDEVEALTAVDSA